MASTIAAITTGIGGIVTTADATGNLSLLSGTSTVVAVTSAGAAVTGTMSVSGATTLTGGLNTPLAVTSGGTGVATSTGSGANVLGTSPTLTTPTISTITSAAATALTLQSASTTAVTIDTSQNVGIGTASPTTKLFVNGGLIAGVENTQTHPNISGVGGFKAQWNYTNGSAETDFYNLYSTATLSFRFWQTTANGAATALCDINANGNFGFNSGYGSVATAYGCRAWVNFNGTGTVAIRASGNVSSITDNGTGDYTVNFTTAMSDVNYSTVGSSADNNGGTTPTILWLRNQATAPTTSAVRVGTRLANNTDGDSAYINIAVFR